MSSELEHDIASDKKSTKHKILTFHKLLNKFSFSTTNYSPHRFEKLLNNLNEQGRGFCDIDQLDKDNDSKDVALTFDDGYAHLSEMLLYYIDKFKIKPTVFIPTAYLGHSNNWDYSYLFQNDPHLDKTTIKRLSDAGVKFGSHGHTHSALTKLTNKNLKEELTVSKNILEDIIGKEVASISYPFGRYNRQILEQTKASGYKYGLTMNFPTSYDTNLTLGRLPVYFYDNIFTINQKLNNGKLYKIEKAKATFIHKMSGGTIILNRLRNK